MLSLWPCLGTTGSHGNSDWGGGGLCQTVRLGSKPTGSLSFNLEAHAADNLPQHCVLLCHAAGFQAEISQPSCFEFTECELNTM